MLKSHNCLEQPHLISDTLMINWVNHNLAIPKY